MKEYKTLLHSKNFFIQNTVSQKTPRKYLISMCSPIARNHSHTAVHQFRCVGENKHAVIPSWVFNFKPNDK